MRLFLINIMNKKIFNIFGLSRSGNHAIIFWLINNLISSSLKEIEPYLFISSDNRLCYLNNLNHKPDYFSNNYFISKYSIIIKSYEDQYFFNECNVIILRDFINLLCSRYKKYYPHIGLNNNYINNIHRLIYTWKQHAKSPKRLLNYNKWIMSKDYRDKISISLLKAPNIRDNLNYKFSIGDGSSFNNQDTDYNKYITRYRYVNLPDYMIDQILLDKELLYLNKKIFNINIESILNDN